MVNFKAQMVSATSIKQFNKNNTYNNKQVAFIEFKTDSISDKKALEKMATSWGEKDIYGRDVSLEFSKKFNQQNIPERFFGITTQLNDFEHLDYKKILGVAETYNEDSKLLDIFFLQTKPKFINNGELKKFKDIGKALMKNILSTIKYKKVIIYPTPDTTEFYKKIGFRVVNTGTMILKR